MAQLQLCPGPRMAQRRLDSQAGSVKEWNSLAASRPPPHGWRLSHCVTATTCSLGSRRLAQQRQASSVTRQRWLKTAAVAARTRWALAGARVPEGSMSTDPENPGATDGAGPRPAGPGFNALRVPGGTGQHGEGWGLAALRCFSAKVRSDLG